MTTIIRRKRASRNSKVRLKKFEDSVRESFTRTEKIIIELNSQIHELKWRMEQ